MSAKPVNKSRVSSRKSGGSQSNSIGLWIVGVSVAVVVLVVALMMISSRQNVIAVETPDVQPEWIDRTTMGNPDASVVVQAWEDFLCPSCMQWTQMIEPRLVEDYVKPGLVRFEFRQFPLQSHAPGSINAALASECAADQGGFWIYHTRLFQAQNSGQSGYTLDRLVQYADEVGLDGRTLLQCMSGQNYAAQVNDSVNQALALGLNATPSVLVNGKRMTDPYDYEALQQEIDQLLAAAGE
ncbi:MAG: DsbA family protein [Chloroflexota bacterium]|nr:DsbA family protein [Chloroflexota bacterium]